MARRRDRTRDEKPRDEKSRGRPRRRRSGKDFEREAVKTGARLAELGVDLGAEVGMAVTSAMREVATQLEDTVSTAVQKRGSGESRPSRRRRGPESRPPRRPGAGEFQVLWGVLSIGVGAREGHLGLVWGLLWLSYKRGEVAFQAIWGLVRFRARLPGGASRSGAASPAPPVPRAAPRAPAAPQAPEGMSAEARALERDTEARDHAREMQNLSASIAHEIRNPITAAKSLVQQMGEDPSSTENVEYAEVALRELERVERSVSHLLRFARDEEVAMRDLNLAEVLESAISAMRDKADQVDVTLHCDVDSPGAMRGDPEKLRRVIINLVRNAVEALGEAEVEKPRVELQMGENLAATEVWLRVRDNGPGIPEDRKAEIFTPFHTSKSSGTGLGLPITKKLVDAHDGTIELTSSPGAGTEFLLTFPKTSAGQAPAQDLGA